MFSQLLDKKEEAGPTELLDFDEPVPPGEIRGDPLPLAHLWWIEQRTHRFEMPCIQNRVGNLAVVATDIVEDTPVGRLNQVGEDGGLKELTVPAIARRYDLLVALCARQQRP